MTGARRSSGAVHRRRALRAAACLAIAAAGVVPLVAAGPATSGPSAGAAVTPVRRVHTVEVDAELRLPAGLAYSARVDRLFAVESAAGKPAIVARITPTGRRTSTIRTTVTLDDPVNIGFDDRRQRLLLAGGGALVELPAPSGRPTTKGARSVPLSTLGVTRPRGLAVDPASGTIYVLDGAGPSLVRLTPADGRLQGARRATVSLRAARLGQARGIAFDPGTGRLQVVSGSELVELTTRGVVVARRGLARLGLGTVSGVTFARSGDTTDDPGLVDLFVSATPSGADRGAIEELSLRGDPIVPVDSVTARLVRTVDLARLDPPSPDPSGIEWVPETGRFVLVDSEVEEVVDGVTSFRGASLWELAPDGTVQRTGDLSNRTSPSISNEPTDVAWDAKRRVFYIPDDDRQRVLTVDPGADGALATGDDTVASFDTSATGNMDPEGVTVDPERGRLYVVDGVNAEIYVYTVAGEPVGRLDVSRAGVVDPEAVELNPDRGTLLVLGRTPVLAEMSTSGAVLRTYDVSAIGPQHPAGLAYAPASDGSGEPSLYIVDRGVDNNTRPGTVDGRLYELRAPSASTPVSAPPVVAAGDDLEVALPAAATLRATVSDDGLPASPGRVSVAWLQVSGPGRVTFSSRRTAETDASFTVPGTYVLRLTATDGEWTTTDELTVTATGSGGIASLDRPVTAGADDAEETTTGVVTITSTDLDLMTDSGSTPVRTNALAGLRFTGLSIPRGARITNAYVQLQTDEPSTTLTTLRIAAQADSDAPAFTTTATDLSSRPVTIAAVAWSPKPWLDADERGLDQRTPNLAPLVQEVVDRAGWAPGNALVILLSGTPASQRVANAFEAVSASAGRVAPELHVEWAAGEGNRVPRVRITSPSDRSTVARGARLRLSATAVDLEDGNLGAALVWRSSRDGLLGRGASVTVANLSPGTHQISAQARDSAGETGRSLVTVTVTR